MTLDDIRAFFGLGHCGSVAGALGRYRRLSTQRPDLQRLEAQVRAQIMKEKT